MDQPTTNRRFSVLIPVYNRPDLVRLTVDSVLRQTFPDYEVIVVDDGSTDQTLATLRSYGDRIKVLKQAHQGAEAARSTAFAFATGEYLVLLDSDDLLYPGALATYDRIIRATNAPSVILGAMSYFDDGHEPRISGPDYPVRYFQYNGFIAKDQTAGLSCSNIVIKTEAVRATGALRPEFSAFPFDGNDIMLLLGTSKPCIILKQPFTVAYRSHETNISLRLDYLLESADCLATFERLGQYPGGTARRFERYAYIGGVAWAYAAKGLRRGHFVLALRLLLRTWPMVTAGIVNTVRRRWRTRTKATLLLD